MCAIAMLGIIIVMIIFLLGPRDHPDCESQLWCQPSSRSWWWISSPRLLQRRWNQGIELRCMRFGPWWTWWGCFIQICILSSTNPDPDQLQPVNSDDKYLPTLLHNNPGRRLYLISISVKWTPFDNRMNSTIHPVTSKYFNPSLNHPSIIMGQRKSFLWR